MRTLAYLLVSLLLLGEAAAGTFYNPVGETPIEEMGETAAAILNDGLSSIQLMYSALERKDAEAFQRNRGLAVERLKQAAMQFSDLAKKMPSREIAISPRTPAEQERIDEFFKVTLPKLNIQKPKTEAELMFAATQLINKLQMQVIKLDVDPKKPDWRAVHDLISTQIDVMGAGLATSLIFAARK